MSDRKSREELANIARSVDPSPLGVGLVIKAADETTWAANGLSQSYAEVIGVVWTGLFPDDIVMVSR